MPSITRVLSLIILACAITVSTALAGQAVVATKPGTNGLIAFKRYLDPEHTRGAIFTIPATGGAANQLTTPPPGVIDDQPDWSPDGTELTFRRCPQSDGTCQIGVVTADGADLRLLGRSCPAGVDPDTDPAPCIEPYDPAFSPDRREIVYQRSRGAIRQDSVDSYSGRESSAIAVMNLDGADVRTVIEITGFVGDLNGPQFSPDGKQIVFERRNSSHSRPAGGLALFVVNVDGTGLHRVTPWSLNAGDGPDWSPNGKLIVFHTYEDGAKQSQIGVVRPDGTGLRTITKFKAGTQVLSSSFSPDGKWITFAKSGRAGQPDIFVMRASGLGIRPVTRTAAWDSAPDWGPTL